MQHSWALQLAEADVLRSIKPENTLVEQGIVLGERFVVAVADLGSATFTRKGRAYKPIRKTKLGACAPLCLCPLLCVSEV